MRPQALVFLCVIAAFAQDPTFDRLKSEAARAKATEPDPKNVVAQIEPMQRALRDWIEAHLPAGKAAMDGALSNIEAGLQAQLRIAGLTGDVGDDDDISFGYAEVEFREFPELPDTLFVIAGASVPCGYDNAVYGYQFGATRTRTFEFHPGDIAKPEIELSAADRQGRRVLLLHGISVQCQSTWMQMAYAAYRFGATPAPPAKLLDVTHGFWFGNVDGPEFHLEPDGLVVEYLDASVDTTIHNRTQVYRYRFGDGVTRGDPVALQPQDFVEEWLTRPWEEMQSRSQPETAEGHKQLHSEYVWGNYLHAGWCHGQPGIWGMQLAFTNAGGALPDVPFQRFFLVRELAPYRYRMEAVSEKAPQDCVVEGEPSDKHPWLPPAQIWALPN